MVTRCCQAGLLACLLFLFPANADATDCCSPHAWTGCDSAGLESCVCGQDPYCCDTEWDALCVQEVEEFGCGLCSAGSGDCCADNGSPGCADLNLQTCVCAGDSYCCETEWDDLCAQEVEEFGCGSCNGGQNDYCPGYNGSSGCCQTGDPCGWASDGICDCQSTCAWDSNDCGPAAPICGDGWCEGDETCANCSQDCGTCQGDGDCCADNGTPGCQDPGIQSCVCLEDSYCCETEWDDICAEEVEEFGCGQCGGTTDYCPGYSGTSDCCTTDDPCGWANDGICDCNETCGWDDGDCGGGDPFCGDGQCAADEDCAICPEDCGACQGDGDCCAANGTPGCADGAIQACVCADDSYCCATEWDDICAGEVVQFGCGNCEAGPVCGDGQCAPGESCDSCPEDCGPCGGQGDCCVEQETPGCNNPTIQACVCAQDSFCCENLWDDICVEEVEEFGCGSCSGAGCGDGACAADEDCLTCPDDCGPCQGADCCQPHETPGCADPGVEACVCAEDAFCCETFWDDICTDEVVSLGCGTCGGQGPVCGNGQCEGGEGCEVCPEDCGVCPGQGSCCEIQDGPGCADPDIQSCVCALDAFCCETQWDDICVEEVEGEGCGSCAGCLPDCAGKQCGGDGCGGTCGACPPDQSCQNGQCVNTGCQPACAGKQCGDDGCGGTCGSCTQGKTCQNGKCIGGCMPDCAGKQCGTDGCGGTCGSCPPGFFCNAGHCQNQCQPDCAGKQCGGDGCGGTCGSCPPGFFCTADGHCNQQCQPNCAGKQCGDDGCGGTCGSCPPDQTCANGHCTSTCLPQCSGKQCGSDGCGGDCGSCPPGAFCNTQGHCVSNCLPDCDGKECGDDGCGGTCGACGFQSECVDGLCQEPCVPNCLGRECGSNGCGGECGICGEGQMCSVEGLCTACQPDCTDRECGTDGCGGTCGTCSLEKTCDDETGVCLAPGETPPIVGEGDVWTDDNWSPSVNQCAPGETLRYGKCIPDEAFVDEAAADDGCSANPRTSHAPSPMWLLLLLPLIALRRRRTA